MAAVLRCRLVVGPEVSWPERWTALLPIAAKARTREGKNEEDLMRNTGKKRKRV